MHSAICIAVLCTFVMSVAGKGKPPLILSLEPEGNLEDPNAAVKSEKGLKLTCKLDTKDATITWKRTSLNFTLGVIPIRKAEPPKQVGNIGTLKLLEPSPKESDGAYQCFAKNADGESFSRKLRIKVTYTPPFDANKDDPAKAIDVTVGQPLEIACPKLYESFLYGKAYGIVYSWGYEKEVAGVSQFIQFPENAETAKNIALTPKGSLVFLYVTKENLKEINAKLDGFLQCKIDAGASKHVSHKFKPVEKKTVNVTYAPQFAKNGGEPQKSIHAVQGKPKAVHCIAIGNPVPTTRWQRQQKNRGFVEIVDGRDGYTIPKETNGRTLFIPRVSKEQHELSYRCIVSNGVGKTIEAYFSIFVIVPPQITEKPAKNVQIPIQSTKELTVEAFGTPTPTITWYRNGKKIQNTPDLTANRNKLIFKNAKEEVAAVYQAVAENPYGMDLTTTVVTIESRAPNIKKFGPFYLFKETEEVLPCNSNAAPQAFHEWTKDGVQLVFDKDKDGKVSKGDIQSDRYSLNSENFLVIKKVTDEDNGKYTCMAKNYLGQDEKTAMATVYDRTRIIQFYPDEVELIPGAVQDFGCQAVADKRLRRVLKYKWLKDFAPLKLSKNVEWIENEKILRIYEPSVQDGAIYTCVAFTDDKLRFSEDRRNSLANVQGMPFPPSNLTITDCYDRSTKITWVPGSSKGEPITHYLIEQESEFEPDIWYPLIRVEDPKLTNFTLELTPWAILRFRMRAVNVLGPSRASMPTGKGLCKTKMGRPSVPKNLRGVPKKANELDIMWDPLTKLDQNAPGCYYRLYYRIVVESSNKNDWILVEFKNVKTGKYAVPNAGTYKLYEFYIYAVNILGSGLISDIVRSRSGQNAPEGSPENVTVTAVTARTCTLSWIPVVVQNGSVDGYRAYHWGKSLLGLEEQKKKETDKRVRREIPASAQFYNLNATSKGVVRGLTPYSSYSIVLKAFNSGGEGPGSTEVAFDTNEDVPSQVSSFDATAFSKFIFVSWGPPLESNGVLLGYAIAAVKHNRSLGKADPPMKSVTFIKLGVNTHEHLFKDITPESNYIVYLKARTIDYGEVMDDYVQTIVPTRPARPRAPTVVGHTTKSVNVTFWFGKSKGGYPTEFKIKYRNKGSSGDYKETKWFNHLDKRWATVGDITQDLHEFITVGRNKLGQSVDSPPANGRPLPYVGVDADATPLYKSTWFIVMMVLIALLLLFVVIVVLYRKRGGAKYQVDRREKERAGMLEPGPLEEEDGMEMTRPDDQPPPYASDGSADKRSHSDEDRDSLDDYEEGPGFKEDGSFVEEYGDDKKKLTDDKDKNASATFV